MRLCREPISTALTLMSAGVIVHFLRLAFVSVSYE